MVGHVLGCDDETGRGAGHRLGQADEGLLQARRALVAHLAHDLAADLANLARGAEQVLKLNKYLNEKNLKKE